MKLSPNGFNFIKNREGFELNAYQDIAGIWTIGYGSLWMPSGRRVKKGDKITIIQAMELLRTEVDPIVKMVDDLVVPELTQNQLDALVSFCYNLGLAAFKGSTLRRIINTKGMKLDDERIKEQWMRWNKYHTPDGKLKVSRGLTNRRLAEWRLFTKVD